MRLFGISRRTESKPDVSRVFGLFCMMPYLPKEIDDFLNKNPILLSDEALDYIEKRILSLRSGQSHENLLPLEMNFQILHEYRRAQLAVALNAPVDLEDLPDEVATRILSVSSDAELAAVLKDHPEASVVIESMCNGSYWANEESTLRRRRKRREKATGKANST